MKLPTNYFMHWFREKIDSKNINLNFHFHDTEQYLDNFITNEIDNWTSDVPVIISAQTGSGKNHFIQETLLPKLIEENPDQNDLMLILSNRIALNRQTKYKLAELLVEYKHTAKYLTEIEKFYMPEGIDQLYLNFDVVTVCSYHQLYERCVRSQSDLEYSDKHAKIDISKFKYIICDECHFFTSDASFNENTFDILKLIVSQGQNAIRLYMSATPEVAFESVLQTEFNFQREHLKQKIHDEKIELEKDVKDVQFFKNLGFKKKNLGKKIWKEFKNNKKTLEELEDAQENLDEHFRLCIDFYCMARNYDYVVPHVYKDNEELVGFIKNSDSKWLIFSDSDGEKIFDLLETEKIDSVFLSRKGINANTELKKSYDYIIEHETTDKKVLISTSLLDNGINVTNSTIKKSSDKVLNIAIDSFDRVQFIQMLGRIRKEKGVSVQLYIKEYSVERLKNLLRKDSDSLVNMLAIKIWNRNSFNDEWSPKFFNPCAVVQLINRMSVLLSLIRREDPDFCIKFSNPTLEADKSKVYDFFKNNSGKEEFWSRQIVDLLESSFERNKRNKYINADIDNGDDDVTRHESKLTDNFIYYLYDSQIVPYYYDEITKNYEYYLDQLTPAEYNRYQHILSNISENISIVEEIELLQKHFDFKSKKVFVDVDLIGKLNDKVIYYENLSDFMYSDTPLQEQLSWIEKSLNDLPSDNTDEVISTVEETKKETTLEEYILAHHITEHDLNFKKTGKYFDEKFLKQSGILKGSDDEKSLANQYFQDSPLTKILNKKWTISDSQFSLRSFNDNSSHHKTYYCFVKDETNSD